MERRGSREATWCRFTQNAVLRLLTNTHVMAGEPLTADEAWQVWQRLTLDVRTAFLAGEPTGVDVLWQKNIAGRATTSKLWTDAYLAALAEASRMELVTFDKGFRNFQLAHFPTDRMIPQPSAQLPAQLVEKLNCGTRVARDEANSGCLLFCFNPAPSRLLLPRKLAVAGVAPSLRALVVRGAVARPRRSPG